MAAAAAIAAAALNQRRADFGNVIQTVVGMNAAQAQDVWDNGIRSIENLVFIDDEIARDLHDDTANHLGAVCKSKWKALIGWAYQQSRSLEPDQVHTIDVTQFTEAVCLRVMRDAKERSREKTTGSEKGKSEAKMPDPWSGRIKDWRRKKRELIAYLGNVPSRRGAGLPLVYVIYSDDDDSFGFEDGAPHALQEIRDAERQGPDFEADNMAVFNILTTWTSGGMAETHVDNYRTTRDGRGAWLEMHAVFDGADSLEAIARDARAIISSADFYSETRNYTIDDYCNKHIRANNMLRTAGQAREPFEQVEVFLEGIKTSKYDAIKTSVLGNEQQRESLLLAVLEVKKLFRSLYGKARFQRPRQNNDWNNGGGDNQ